MGINKAYSGQKIAISFKKTYKKPPLVIVGEEIYSVATLSTTKIKLYSINTSGFGIIVLQSSSDYSPQFNYLVIEQD
ncbi:hypothetical protein C4N20_15595 [Fusobacterium ulcerans]|uniref:hypothetical protein n=1 Tax=Fusobacterium ulcerans TaxID=861 RepID=UPI0001BC5235|nr:hypothetical protein [Fusobacterium ulcerans]AVQ28856.1 hypothetical protein C4N20_12450 [Fusobacterium ulcerans]AVQ29455.1 hypothetical protein C4N20_15595 [Fusobacterium ulcerans]